MWMIWALTQQPAPLPPTYEERALGRLNLEQAQQHPQQLKGRRGYIANMGRLDYNHAWASWIEAQQKLIKEGKTMEVYSDLIETTEVHDGIVIELTAEDASKLRRACYFNKTIGERVAKRDGRDAGDEMHGFLAELGDSLADEGIERWDGREG